MASLRVTALAVLLAGALTPSLAQACACGCDVFDVGGPERMSMAKGGEVFVNYGYMDQSQNWSGDHSAPAANNDDKEIRTHLVTAGLRYAISPNWGVLVEAPLWNRTFHTENDAGTGVDRFNHTALGDLKIVGVYTGLAKDMSTGLTFGVKLATGDWKYAHFDRDTQIGTGSTNLLLGAYHNGFLSPDRAFGYYVKAQWDKPVASQGGYEPGDEIDAGAGVTYNVQRFADGPIKVVPVLQMLASSRARDHGPNADPDNSGYSRLMLSPGVEVTNGAWAFYADVELPVYQHVNGNQLIAPELVKLMVSRRF